RRHPEKLQRLRDAAAVSRIDGLMDWWIDGLLNCFKIFLSAVVGVITTNKKVLGSFVGDNTIAVRLNLFFIKEAALDPSTSSG
ncbi:MAG: hypothetical protein ACO1NZ_12780, partial [Adhaeribacter sp.]